MQHHSKIVCTIGRASESEAILSRLIEAGMGIARLNFSHGDHAWHRRVCQRLRRLSDQVAIMGDIQGPKLRIGTMQGDRTVMLEPGATFVLTSRAVEGTAAIVSVDYATLPQEMREGETLYLNDGLIALQVLEVRDGTDIVTQVRTGGALSGRKGINVPYSQLSAQVPTAKDRQDIGLAAALGLDFLAVSFVSAPSDLARVRAALREVGADMALISKIERAGALKNLEAIIDASDGLMVARGDLAVEIPPEEVPYYQKEIIRRCNQVAKPVICATQMLESMCLSPVPTRAEVSDVFNAIIDGADAVMLSAESASGLYPVEAVEMMVRIIHNAETTIPRPAPVTYDSPEEPYSEIIAHGISTMVERLTRRGDRIGAIVAITRGGYSARMLAKYRPGVPIIAATNDRQVARQLLLSRGITPMLLDTELDEPAALTQAVIVQAFKEGRIHADDIVLTASASGWAPQSRTNFIGQFAVRELLERQS